MPKVLSYLEYTDYVVSDITGLVYIQENIPPDLRVITPICSLDELMSFYSQPFRPELITELFEDVPQLMDYKIIPETKEVLYKMDNTYFMDKLPRTLDDFINDCQRAGIQLEWRQQ